MRSNPAPSHERAADGFLRDVLGFAALVLTLALTSPGVQIARADEAAAMSVDPALTGTPAVAAAMPAAVAEKPAPSCSDPAAPVPLSDAVIEYQTRRMLQEVARRAAAEHPPGEPPGEQGIVLNGHGYNYRPTKLP